MQAMGNLITYNAAFDWSAPHIDRNTSLNMLNEALISANEFNDNLYYHPNLFSHGESSLTLFMLLWSSDFETFRLTYPWIKEPQFQVLVNLRNYFRSSPNNSGSLQALRDNSGINNNAWIGLTSHCPEYLVFSKSSWVEFHRIYVSTFTFEQRGEHFDYFLKFYQPNLVIPLNQIQQSIDEGHVHNSITRIDPPLIPFEKIHIHFNNNENCALNIDGTWKHEVVRFVIPRDACEQLNEWGFLLPRQYYQI